MTSAITIFPGGRHFLADAQLPLEALGRWIRAKTNPAAFASDTAQGGDVTSVNRHPCQFSPEVLEVLAGIIRPGEHVHDPFAGPGLRLGRLCDQLGATFTGTDIESWPGRDQRVVAADARDPLSYPCKPFTIVTSPVYANKRCADYPYGPTSADQGQGPAGLRYCALGRALHPRTWPAVQVGLVERSCTGRVTRRR